jgi:predicted permease
MRRSVRPDRFEAEMADELRAHLEMEADARQARGAAPDAARREAAIAFGHVESVKESVRDRQAGQWFAQTAQDVRYAVRLLAKWPTFSAVVIGTIALAVCGTATIFSAFDAALLRPLPYPEPDRLVQIVELLDDGSRNSVSAGAFLDWRANATRLDSAVLMGGVTANLRRGRGAADRIAGAQVSHELLRVFGVSPILGRGFGPDDDKAGGANDVVLLTESLWRSRFGADAAIVGTPITLDERPRTVIGVLPDGIYVEPGVQFFVPAVLDPADRGEKQGHWAVVFARMTPGTTVAQLDAELKAVKRRLNPAYPSFKRDWGVQAIGLQGEMARDARPLLIALGAAVTLVLLIACANIANLLLARATARRHELSVRLALGATRWRLVRLLLVEALVLAGVGALAGLVFARWAGPMLVAQLSTSVTRVTLDLSLDWRVLAFTVAVTAATAVLFGTAPAFRARRIAPIDALKEQGRGALGDGRTGLSGSLVVAQVALSMVLIVAAGLLVGTFERLATLPLGFDSDRILIVNVDVSRAPIDPANRIPFFHQLVAAVAAVPGVARAGGSMATPVSGSSMLGFVDPPGAPPPQPEPGPVPFWNSRMTMLNQITPGWLATYGTAVRDGRDIDDRDTQGALPVALVNEAYARKFLPDRNPIGETITFAEGMSPSRTIVGVVSDAVYVSVRDGVRPTLYIPLAQRDAGGPTANVIISVRSSAGSPVPSEVEGLAPRVAAALTGVERNLTLTFRPLQDRVDASLTQERLVALVTGFFGTLALLLAGLGLYGVTSYAVTRRRAEIGIRMALGAEPSGVVRLALVRVFVLVALGVIIGTAVSWWSSQFVASLLYDLQPRDAVTLVSAAVTLTVVGAVAGWLPAYRASRIDPAHVLRDT